MPLCTPESVGLDLPHRPRADGGHPLSEGGGLVGEERFRDSVDGRDRARPAERRSSRRYLAYRRALTLNPNSANAWRASGMVRTYLGDTDLAIGHLERSVRLSPLDALAYICWLGFAYAHFVAGRYEDASAWSDKTLHEAPDYPPALRMKAAICGRLGQIDEARAWVERLLAIAPHTTLSSMRPYYGEPMKKPGSLESLLEGLRKAGLPE